MTFAQIEVCFLNSLLAPSNTRNFYSRYFGNFCSHNIRNLGMIPHYNKEQGDIPHIASQKEAKLQKRAFSYRLHSFLRPPHR
jgi:hypothetical protein